MVSIGDISVERDADSRRDHKSPNSRKDAHSTDKENIFANAGGSREREVMSYRSVVANVVAICWAKSKQNDEPTSAIKFANRMRVDHYYSRVFSNVIFVYFVLTSCY